MLVLGRKHKFSEQELQKLNKKFKNIKITRYTQRVQDDVLQELEEAISSEHYTLLVLNTKAKVGDDIIKFLTNLQFREGRKPLRIISIENFMERYLQKCYIPDDHTNLDFLESIKPFNPVEYALKRAIDYVAIVLLYVLASPIIYYSRYKIKKESPGTSMFKQLRVGLNGKDFKCNKFRSMHLNVHHDPYTRKNDSRVFPWGEVMRKTRIDELPQMLNVLKGDMHFIGPRAEWNILVEEYEKKIPYYNERHIVRPGITGWAQVNYSYGSNIEDTRQKLMYDLYYIKHWSVALELKVVWKTIMVVLGRKGL
ncbi:MAG: sugar transferase [Sulfurimonadaceae bacterium]|jgi:lipopolysaccharide/colanic/teichoic acid biosynthesis glycosyltransferase|nr:sugar transferase [Sulfurimonadaceae bacterium]